MSNKIKSETIYRVDHVPGEVIDLNQEFDHRQSYREYDETGRLLLEIAYTQDGEIADKVSHRYDETGRLLESHIYGEDDEILERKEVVWGNEGRVTRELTHYLDGSTDTHEYFYDHNGKLIGMKVKDDEDELEFSEKFFHEGDKLVKVERCDSDDKVIFRQEDEYVDGIFRARKIWSSEEEEPYTMIQQFNAAGHREQELRYNSREQLIERNISETDEQGRVVRIVEENRQRKNTTEFTFDGQGNVTHQVETDLNGNLNHKVYREYSKEGELLLTTVEAVIKSSGAIRAYSLIIKKENF